MSEQDFCIKLVQAVEKYPCLYNYKLSDYSRKDVVDKAWVEVIGLHQHCQFRPIRNHATALHHYVHLIISLRVQIVVAILMLKIQIQLLASMPPNGGICNNFVYIVFVIKQFYIVLKYCN
jgi:hypothetical protein